MDNLFVLSDSVAAAQNIDFFTTTYSPIFDPIVKDIQYKTALYNNAETLIAIFPEKIHQIENFEISLLESDDSVYEVLSTPDLKIFYPEPFVASPSFVHEDF